MDIVIKIPVSKRLNVHVHYHVCGRGGEYNLCIQFLSTILTFLTYQHTNTSSALLLYHEVKWCFKHYSIHYTSMPITIVVSYKRTPPLYQMVRESQKQQFDLLWCWTYKFMCVYLHCIILPICFIFSVVFCIQ